MNHERIKKAAELLNNAPVPLKNRWVLRPDGTTTEVSVDAYVATKFFKKKGE
jgi:hypothetical protein